MPQLIVKVQNKIAKPLNNFIVCGNNDYTVKFIFDKEWNNQTVKTARFIWNNQYQDIVFSGDTCTMPVIENATTLGIGVYAGSLNTTTPAIVTCTKSVLCGLGCPKDPPEDVYNQIIKLLNEDFNEINKNINELEKKHDTDVKEIEKRIDNIIVEGTPTEGNAELIDIRLGADGVPYDTAGEAVRTQFENVENNVTLLETIVASLWEPITSTGVSVVAPSDHVHRNYVKCKFSKGRTYRIRFKLKAYTPYEWANASMVLRTTMDQSVDNIRDDISGTYAPTEVELKEYIWYLTPTYDDAEYVYILLQPNPNTSVQYTISIDECRNSLRGSNLNIRDYTEEDICSSDLNNLPNNFIYGCSVTDGSLANVPITDFRGQIITYGKNIYRTTSDTQIFFHESGKVYARIYWGDVWKEWIEINKDGVRFYSDIEVNEMATNYSNLLSNVTENAIFFVSKVNTTWTDIPSGVLENSCVFTNQQYSTNYSVQTLSSINNGNEWKRIVDRRNGSVFTDWTAPTALQPLKILALGDSICAGHRNQKKGFVGDLGLPYKNIGVSSATLSTVNTAVINIPQQLVNETEYEPDVIIANGGINDYNRNAPLGEVPAAPAFTETEAKTLDRSTVTGGLGYLFFTMINKFPKAQRFFVIVHKMKRWDKPDEGYPYYPATANEQGYTQQDLHDVIVEMCNLYNVKVIDVYKDSIINTAFKEYVSDVDYSADNNVTYTDYVNKDCVHPLDLGYREGYIPLVRQALGIGTVKTTG